MKILRAITFPFRAAWALLYAWCALGRLLAWFGLMDLERYRPRPWPPKGRL